MRRPPKFVQAFLDRHDKPRFYFRRAGSKAVPLPGLPWSPEFMAAYELAMASSARREEVGASRTNPGTINALIVSYYKSDEWNRLTPETQKTRRRIVERFRIKHGEKRVALLQREHIIDMLDDIDGVFAK